MDEDLNSDPAESSESWKISLPCNRAEAEAIGEADDMLSEFADPPVVAVREPDPARPDDWLIEAYCSAKPSTALVAAVRRLAPSSSNAPVVERVVSADWVSLSQAGLEPVNAGRFHVCTPVHADEAPRGPFTFMIDAGRAFGTGQHHTTTGCLMMLDRLKRLGVRFDNVIDVGTGTGLLGFAAHRLWPRADVIASDIDPVAIEVARLNAAENRIPIGARRGSVELVTAPGLGHSRIRRRAPYDLIVANILAGPLIEMAPDLVGALHRGGYVMLAGLLDHQAEAVTAAYCKHGMRPVRRIDRDEWPTLLLVKRHGRTK